MSVGVFRILIVAAVCGLGLSGCETMKTALTEDAPPASSEPQITGAVPATAAQIAANTNGLLGGDPHDDLNQGKKYYRAGDYGIAEQRFRRAVEQHPTDAEAWLGLAASYDQLRRFDLADRAYAQVLRIAGPKPEILNNQGYSYLLRGDYRQAREKLLAAQAGDPKSPYIQANLALLGEAVRKRKAVN